MKKGISMPRKKPLNKDHVQAKAQEAIQNSGPSAARVANGFAEAIGFNGGPFGFGLNGQAPEQISSINTIFKNLRWYLVSNFRQPLSEAYVEIGLIQTIVDLPVDDALRGGVEIKSKQLEEQQIEELQVSMDRDDDLNTVGQAAKWMRLFGGGAVMIFTDQDPETPLDVESLSADDEFDIRAVDMWELTWTMQNADFYDPTTQQEDFEFYDYYGMKVHKSRVIVMKGRAAPSFIRPRLRGWGFSEMEILVRSINQYLKATDLSFEVLDEFKLDVYKIKNLVDTLLSPAGEQNIRQRVQMANWQKNYQNAIVMDSEDDFDHKQLSFAGLAEAMAGIRMQVASDMRMPLTKLFGISAAGFNSGEDDIEVYNSMIESQVRNKIKYAIMRVVELKCQHLFGFIPDDLAIGFKSLRVLGAEQEENVKTQKFARLMQLKDAGEITTLEFRDAINKGDLIDITLDTSQDALDMADPEISGIVAEGENDPEHPKDDQNPGEGRADEEKLKAKDEGGTSKGLEKPKEAKAAKVPKDEKKTTDVPRPVVLLKAKTYNVQQVGLVKPYGFVARMERILKNSIEYDKAAYEADGGDGWINPGRELFFSDPLGVDPGLWARAKEESAQAYGQEKWQFTVWLYKKLGGSLK